LHLLKKKNLVDDAEIRRLVAIDPGAPMRLWRSKLPLVIACDRKLPREIIIFLFDANPISAADFRLSYDHPLHESYHLPDELQHFLREPVGNATYMT
jgi:hypothetical protein